MKNFTILHTKYVLLVLILFNAYSLLSQTTIATYDFESGDQGWTLDTSSILNTNSGNSCEGNNSIRIADNNTTSIATSPALNLSGYDSVNITFCIRTSSNVDNSEGIDLKYSSNGGGYTTLKTFIKGTDFRNNSVSYTFSINLTTGLAINSRFRFEGENSDSNEYSYFDNVLIEGHNLTVGPGGITNNLELWLKGTDGLAYTDGDRVSLWSDQGRGANAVAPVTAVRPTYRNHPTQNINFNPVVDFDNSYDPVPLDGDFSFDNPDTEFLAGTGGYYSQDIFVVLIPNVTVNSTFGSMDVFCGDENISANETDATGIGLGAYSARFSGEILCYAHGTTSGGNGYGVAEIGTGSTYSNSGIINARNNIGATQQQLFYNAINKETTQNDVADFANINDSRYWIGRSEGWEASTDARIAEIITYSSRKSDTDLTQERNRIQSYLAVKYGITLGVNGTSQDYVNSDGTVIWDVNTGVPAEDAFNYDISGIGRDDVSDLYQKQSRSVNNAADGTGRTQGVLTMGVTDLYDTNSQNPHTLENKQFLMWGNDGVNLENPAVVVDVNMSTDIAPALESWVQFNGIARTWKVVENGGDIPTVKVAMLRSAIRTATPPDGHYLMFISDTPNFDPTADYRIMTEDVNELGENVVTTDYDFDGTKYITFGWAPERVYERSISFNGTTNYIDMEDNLNLNTTGFTVSAWINRDVNSGDRSILSKRATAYGGVRGYDFRILADGRFNVRWRNSSGTNQELTSSVAIPLNIWHNIAVIYDGVTATIYIDGVADTSANLTAPATYTHSFLIGAGGKGTIDGFFHGSIDEVRIWNTDLTVDQLRFVMNQEIEQNTGFVRGSYFENLGINPTKNDIASVPWSQLAAYYPMTTYTYTNTKDASGNGIQGALRALRTVDRQTAPLPYISSVNGNWTTNATWTNGSIQAIPGSPSIVNPTITVDWNIVETNHTITIDRDNILGHQVSTLGLLVNSNTLTVDGSMTDGGTGNALTVTHYLNLDGKIDLQGESQLVQTLNSDLDVTSSGTLEKDQQGTRDLFTYNYWAAPVGVSNTTTNNNSYSVPNILFDGTNPESPQAITFLTSGYNGNPGPPISIANYWIWKYSNQTSNDYPSWQHIRSTGTMKAGEGFTMKGVENTAGDITQEQNYVFIGKPNNGLIDNALVMASGNDYLIGNPYPSAMDADAFLRDNLSTPDGGNNSTNVINGALYFWDHFASGTHVLADYEGGYATYTLMGGANAICNDIRINATGLSGTKVPERYIPVGQGFFVSTGLESSLTGITSVSGGTIVLNNNQRTYKRETVTGSNGGSVFFRTSDASDSASSNNQTTVDTREKIRLMFDSPNGYHRQLLVGVDTNASNGFNIGYDAPLNETNLADLFWVFDATKFVIQAVGNFNPTQILPLGVKTNTTGMATIRIETLENIPDTKNIYLHDIALNIYHDLRQSDYTFTLPTGEYLDRFEITFSTSETLDVGENLSDIITISFNNDNESIMLTNPEFKTIKSIEMFNILGQSIITFDDIEPNANSEYKTKNLSSGTYIIKVYTDTGSFSKKVLVK